MNGTSWALEHSRRILYYYQDRRHQIIRLLLFKSEIHVCQNGLTQITSVQKEYQSSGFFLSIHDLQCHRIHEIEYKHEQQNLLRCRGNTMEHNFIYSMFLYTIQLLKCLLCFLNIYIYIVMSTHPRHTTPLYSPPPNQLPLLFFGWCVIEALCFFFLVLGFNQTLDPF